MKRVTNTIRPKDAPECNPKIPGSASALRDNPCKIAPEIPRPIPANIVIIILGIR